MWCFMLYNGSESRFYGSKSVNNNNMQPAVISVKIPEKNFKISRCVEISAWRLKVKLLFSVIVAFKVSGINVSACL